MTEILGVADREGKDVRLGEEGAWAVWELGDDVAETRRVGGRPHGVTGGGPEVVGGGEGAELRGGAAD